jgi:serine/threonine protein kinase
MKLALSKWIPKQKLSGSVQIDSGSFGKIYRCTYKDTEVAVKEIAQASSLKSKMKDISYELDALVLCDHPNVVRFHGAALAVSTGSGQPSIALVFELCEKGSLHRNIFERKRTLSVKRKVIIGSQVHPAAAAPPRLRSTRRRPNADPSLHLTAEKRFFVDAPTMWPSI